MPDLLDVKLATIHASVNEVVAITNIINDGGSISDVNEYLLKRNDQLVGELREAKAMIKESLDEVNSRQETKVS